MKVASPMQGLPNEMLLQIFGHLDAPEVARMAQVNTHWHFLVHEPNLQRRVFEPELRQPLAALQAWYQRRKAMEASDAFPALYTQVPPGPSYAEPLSTAEVHRRLVAERSRQPTAAQPSLMRLGGLARQAWRQLLGCEWAAWTARCFAPSAWQPLMKLVALGCGATAFLCDQGSINAAPLLVDLGILLGAYTLLFALCTPVLWFLYNCAGTLAEEWALSREARLQEAMQAEFAPIATLLRTEPVAQA